MADITSSLRVLIVDDHMLTRQMISNVVREKKVATIDTAGDGKKAREMIDAAYTHGTPYHIVFLDWEMPIMPGIEVLQFFRSQPQFNGTAFVMVTSVADQGFVLEAVKGGATAYIVKPVSQKTLDKKFDEVLNWMKKNKVQIK